MNNGGEAADQMVREALQFSEVAIKLTALGFKNSLAIALAYAKEKPKVRGKTSLDRLLREGKEMKIIPLQTKDGTNLGAGSARVPLAFRSWCGPAAILRWARCMTVPRPTATSHARR